MPVVHFRLGCYADGVVVCAEELGTDGGEE